MGLRAVGCPPLREAPPLNDREVFLLAGAFLAGALAFLIARARWRAYRQRRRFRVGREAEDEAVTMAKRAGYRVLGSQVEATYVLRAGDETKEITVRADMMLERRGRRFVAEVKSGKKAPDPSSRATRRQLFEYAHVFEADGLLLFDMTARRIREVRFEGLRGVRAPLVWPWVLFGISVGVAIAVVVSAA